MAARRLYVAVRRPYKPVRKLYVLVSRVHVTRNYTKVNITIIKILNLRKSNVQ